MATTAKGNDGKTLTRLPAATTPKVTKAVGQDGKVLSRISAGGQRASVATGADGKVLSRVGAQESVPFRFDLNKKRVTTSANEAIDQHYDMLEKAESTAKTQQLSKPTRQDNLNALKASAKRGWQSFNNRTWSTIDWLIPDEAVSDLLGVENKVGDYFDTIKRMDEQQEQEYLDTLTKAGQGTQVAGMLTRGVIEAAPQAILAMLTHGASLGGQTTSAGLSATATAAQAGNGVLQTGGRVIGDMLKNPSFWTSVATTVGPAYDEAKAAGATEFEANAVAILYSMGGAAIEVGGGIETLPSTTPGLLKWVRSSGEEALEEVLQGGLEHLTKKAFYDHEKEWVSLTDPDAVVSFDRAVQEAFGGFAIGGVLGGGMTGIQVAGNYLAQQKQYGELGAAYLAQTGGDMATSIRIAMQDTVPGTDAHTAAQTMLEELQEGREPSLAAFGRVLAESQSEANAAARQRYDSTLESAATTGVQAEVAEPVARVAARLGLNVKFAANEQFAVTGTDGETHYAAGRYVRQSDTVLLNAAANEENLTGYLLAHELTHSVEGTAEYQTLATTVQRMIGEETWQAEVAAMQESRNQLGDTMDAEGAAKEVLAHWIGENLYTGGFARAVVSGKATSGGTFLRALDKVRLALGVKNSRSARNIAMLERLFMQAWESKRAGTETAPERRAEVMTTEDEGQHSLIIRYTDGRTEELSDARNLTSEQALAYLDQAKTGVLKWNTYIPVRKDTPQVIIDTLEQVNENIDNRSLVMQVHKAQQAMKTVQSNRRSGKYGSNTRGHALTPNQIVEIVNNLDNPDTIIYQTNRRDSDGNALPNNVAVFVEYNNDAEGLAVIEFDASIDPEFIGGEFGDTEYHTVVTVFEPDTERNGLPFDYAEELLSNPNNIELEIKRRPHARNAIGKNHPNTSSELPSNTTIAKNAPGVNPYSMQNGQKNSGNGQNAFIGYASDGKGIYQGNFPLGTPKAAKSERILNYIRSVWSKQPIPLRISENGETRIIHAQFDPTYDESGNTYSDATKLMGGNRHGTAAEQRVTLDLADDYYQIASEAKYNYSKDETGKETASHVGVKKWHYFINDIYFAEYGSDIYTPYRVTINVKEKADGDFVYSFSAEKIRESDTPQTLHAVVNEGENSNANIRLSNTTLPQNGTGVNTQSMQDGENYAPDGQNAFLPEGAFGSQVQEGAGKTDYPSVTASGDTSPDKGRQGGTRRNGSRTVAQGQTLEELAQELGDRELDRRMYMAMQTEKLPTRVTLDGIEMDTATYLDAVEERLPDSREELEAYITKAEERLQREMQNAYEAGDIDGVAGLPVNLQLFAARRKLAMTLEGGEEGSEERRFYWQRTRGLDANKAHEAELLEYLAGRSETYNPISNQEMLDKAKDALRRPGYAERLVKRLGRYNPKDRFTEVEMAAAMVLINDAKNDGDLELYTDLVTGLSWKGTDAGRAVQILSMQAKLTPEGTIRAARRTLRQETDRVHGEGTSEAVDELAGTVVDAVERAVEAQTDGERAEKAEAKLMPTFEEDGGFFRQIDEWKTLNETAYVTVGAIPAGSPLHQVGLPAGKLYFDVSKIRKAMADHSDHMSPDILKKIPELLKNPIAIVEYKPGEGTNTVNIYGDLYYHNTPVAVGIVVTLGRDGAVISKIRTVHARRDFAKQITDDSILYLGENKNETDSWFQAQGQRVPMRGTIYGFIRSIAHPFGNVNPPDINVAGEQTVTPPKEGTEKPRKKRTVTPEQAQEILERVIKAKIEDAPQLRKWLTRKDIQVTLAQRIAKLVSEGTLNDATMERTFREVLELPALTPEDVGTLTGLVNAMQNAEEGTAQHQEAMEDIYRFLGSKLPVTFMESWQSWRKFAMLANPKTHLRNTISNVAMFGGVEKLDTAIATGLQRLFVDKQYQTAALGWRGTAHGKSILPAVEKATERAVVRKREGGGKYDVSATKLGRYKRYFRWEWLNKASDFNSKALEDEDIFFFRRSYADALGQILVARGLTEVTPEIDQMAYDRAVATVFQADNAINDVLTGLKRWANSDKAGRRLFGYAVDVVIPFSKTPANVMKQTVLHSPVGVIKGAWDIAQACRKGSPQATAEAVNTLAKGVTGSVLTAIGLLLGSAGLFNTGFGKTEKERAADELAGVQENALVFGNWSVTLDWLQPAASPLIVGASIAQRLREDGFSLGEVFGAVMDGTDSLFELSMLQSLYDILGGYDVGATATLGSVAENLISQSIPTLVGQAARAIDPVQRKTKGDNDFETVVNRVLAKLPGLTYLLEPELDVWGNEVYRTGKAGTGAAAINALQQFLSPSNVKVGTGDDELSREIIRLYNEQGAGAIPSAISRDEAIEHGLDYTGTNRTLGKVNRTAVEQFFDDLVAYTIQEELPNGKKKTVSKRYSDMTDEERRRVLGRIYKNAKAQYTDEEADNAYFEDLIRRLG